MGVQIWAAYFRQPLCARLHWTSRQAAARETSAASPQGDLGAVRGLAECPPLIGLAVAECLRAMWVTGVKSACHRQLNGVPRRPAERPSIEQKCRQKALDGKQSWETEEAVAERGERTGRCSLSYGDFISAFLEITSSVIFLFISVCRLFTLCTVTRVAPITEIYKVPLG